MRYLFTALGVLFLLAAIYMATAYFCFRKAARRGREANIDKFLAAKQFDGYREELSAAIAYVRLLPYEDVYITSGDGLRLHAKVFRAENERAAVLLFHGYRSDYGYFDFGCGNKKISRKRNKPAPCRPAFARKKRGQIYRLRHKGARRLPALGGRGDTHFHGSAACA